MNSIIFCFISEYSDYSSKMTIKQQGREIRIEMWWSNSREPYVINKKYFTATRAYQNYKMKVGEAVLGGWQVLNAFPKRETWETKRSK